MKDQTDRNTTTGAGSATGRADERIDEGNEETFAHDKAKAAGSSTNVVEGHVDNADVTGFAPFRAWANRQLRRIPPGATLEYAGHDRKVTEITVDGQLRLEWGGIATLIPFDERYIPALLKQLLTTE